MPLIKDWKKEFSDNKKFQKFLNKEVNGLYKQSTLEDTKSFYEKIKVELQKKFKKDKEILNLIKQYENKLSGITLLDALKSNSHGNKQKMLARESVTSLLNSAHSGINYHYDTSKTIEMTKKSLDSG